MVPAERMKTKLVKLQEAVQTASGEELELLQAMLSIDPNMRPKADEVLKSYAYFADLPPEQMPEITAPVDPAIISQSFKFEKETLGTNELRILISNDLFMSQESVRSRGESASAKEH